MDPLVFGSYPAVMKEIAGSRLPSFTAEESKMLRGSFDYIGLNHYNVFYVKAYPQALDSKRRDYVRDTSVKLLCKSIILERTPVHVYVISTIE